VNVIVDATTIIDGELRRQYHREWALALHTDSGVVTLMAPTATLAATVALLADLLADDAVEIPGWTRSDDEDGEA
jgi:hypothetical protein